MSFLKLAINKCVILLLLCFVSEIGLRLWFSWKLSRQIEWSEISGYLFASLITLIGFYTFRYLLKAQAPLPVLLTIPFLFFFAQSTSKDFEWTLGESAAILSDYFGFYEFGERIYSRLDRFDDSSLATVLPRSSHDNDPQEIDEQRLNRAVSRLYGAHSRQMANRLLILGIHLQQNFSDYKHSSEKCHQASLLYQDLGDQNSALNALGLEAYCYYVGKENNKLDKTLREAASLNPPNARLKRVQRSLAALWSFAHQRKLGELQGEFLKRLGTTRLDEI